MNILYTFDANKLLKLLLLQNISNYFFITLGIYLLGVFLLYVTFISKRLRINSQANKQSLLK